MRVVFDTNTFVSAMALPRGRAEQAILRCGRGLSSSFSVKNYHHSLDAVKESAQAPLPFQWLIEIAFRPVRPTGRIHVAFRLPVNCRTRSIRHPIDVAVSDRVGVAVVDMLTHGLGRERQMSAHPPSRTMLEQRPALWALCAAASSSVPAAGFIQPQGQLSLSMLANPTVQAELSRYLEAPQAS